ncbi:MAG: efflux RND transporter permease subunit, partial [bacterium]|nr:efflux RND transporter permease subunit [Candidatus Aphodosoma intestinipullorum]
MSPASKKTEVWSKIKLKLDVAKATFPPGVLAVAVMDDFSSVSALLIAMESDDKGYSEMKEYADRLCSRLRTIPELANVKVVGAQEEEIAVTLDMEKLSAYGISPSSLMLNYQTSGLLTMGGTFKTDYINAPIYIANPVSTEKEIADHIVYSDPAGNIVRLSDIATVERRCKEADSKVNYNGNSALILSVEMRPGNNIVEFGQKVDDVLVDFSHELPDSVTMSRITDQPKVVSTSVMSFLRDLVISMLVVIAVMLMLFPLRSALIASSGVPVCTAVAIAIMYVTGIDLNTVTLAALIVVLGMIVDDSIITMDGYMDNLGKGMSRIDAATASANELFMPMFMATAAISVMFFPIKGIITGYLGDFVSLFPWVIAIALGTSLAYAMLVVPSLEVRFIGNAQNSKANLFSRIQKKFFDGMQNGYEKIQAVCFRHPKLTILCGLAAVAFGILMFLQLNVQMMPMAARDMFAVEIYLESNSGLEQTEAVADSLQDMLLKDKRVKSVTAFIGTGAPRFNATYAPVIPSRNFAQLVVNTESTKATEALLKEYQERYADIFPEALLRFKQMDYQAVSCPVSVELRGGSHEEMRPFADSIRNFMYGMDDMLQWVHSDCDNFITSVKVNLDPEEAARTGVNRTMLSLYMAGAFNGQPIASLWDGDEKIPVNLYNGALTDSMSYSTISNQTVPTSMPDISVPLRQIA